MYVQTFNILSGSTSRIIPVYVPSSLLTGTTLAGLTGIAFNGLNFVGSSCRSGVRSAISLATATPGTWSTGGWIQIDATNLPGWYEFGIPNAILAASAGYALLHFSGFLNMATVPVLINMVATANYANL